MTQQEEDVRKWEMYSIDCSSSSNIYFCSFSVKSLPPIHRSSFARNSVPKNNLDYPIRGFEFYDGPVGARNIRVRVQGERSVCLCDRRRRDGERGREDTEENGRESKYLKKAV